jgi:hypothetical protein
MRGDSIGAGFDMHRSVTIAIVARELGVRKTCKRAWIAHTPNGPGQKKGNSAASLYLVATSV